MKKDVSKLLTTSGVVIFLAVFCNFLWGSAFPGIKIGYKLFQIDGSDTFSQILFAGCRFTLAGILTILIGSIYSRKVLLPNKGNAKKILILALFQTILQYIFFYIGLANTTGVKASIIEGANVFIVIILSALIFKMEKNAAAKLLGCIPGFIGVVLVNLSGSGLTFSFNIAGEGFILISTFSAAMAAVLIKRFSVNENPVLLSGYQFMTGGVVMVIAGIIGGGRLTISSLGCLFIILYLAFVSAAAYSIWGLLLKYNPVSKISVYGFTNPVFGVILSAIVLHESTDAFGIVTVISLVLVCLGIYLVNSKPRGLLNSN